MKRLVNHSMCKCFEAGIGRMEALTVQTGLGLFLFLGPPTLALGQ
ncbi:hypothetical protein DSOL_1305 [Desulfosporosinus metallidurans]|uniref:Uncharacterized protein n=1 Tax=Desulfosporosinus metallidurans TaxID=1888891 RepID=A0A1Q8QZQ4_9FIRM|nr:hypothetical protein DSOL_1305 [Desulfosporosinus metallidurans]